MKNKFDVIVLGVGSMGSSTCYCLAKQGYAVLGLEQFTIPHDQGSHAGQTRIIRKAYFEHADYVPLLERAYKNWSDFQSQTETQLYYPTGLLYAGKPEGMLMKGVRESASRFGVSVESLSNTVMRQRYPVFNIPSSYEVLFEPDAGFLTPERAVSLYVEHAIRFGATIQANEKVRDWKKNGDSIEVVTDKGNYYSDRLVVTAGAWAGQLVSLFSSKFTVTRQVIAWVNTKQPELFSLDRFPCWLIENDAQPGMHYGMPQLPLAQFGEPDGLKVAHHLPGSVTDPDQVNRMVTELEENDLVQALQRYIPDAYLSTNLLKTCLYTITPDEHFVIDFLPDYDKQVAVAAGFSGHGFKFVSVVGEIMADLVTKGNTELPIEFLNANRFNG
jgi:sarcosine oxidase